MQKIILFILVICFSLIGYTQERQLSGTVTDSEGVGIPGVTVVLKGTTIGTITDINGKYSIKADQGTLVFSFIGFITQEVEIGDQSVISVELISDIKGLDEVVVIGYGTQRKKDLTTAVSIVGQDEIKERPMVSAAEALQGKAAGVQVIQPSGKPGVALSVRVRGATSVEAGNEPLYVVDGLPTTDIKGIDPNDIESMSVLKDASSSSIYGARAANGVVIITTKRAKEGQTQLNFNTYFGISNIRKTIDVLNTKQYRDLMQERGEELDPADTYFNDWNKEVFGTGKIQSYQLSFSDGNEKSQYYLAVNYLNNKGIVRPARFDRISVRYNLDNQIRPWLKMKSSVNLLNIKTEDTPDNASSGRGGVIMAALNTPPFLRVYNPDGSGQFDTNPFQASWENPVAYMEGADQQAIDRQLFGNIMLEARILDGLFYKNRFGVDINNHQWNYYLDPFRTNYGRNNNGVGQADKYMSQSWMLENMLDYSRTIGAHNFTGLIGTSIQKFEGHDSYLYGTDFPEDVSVTSLNAANTITGSTWKDEWSLASYFGRATYDFKNKYYISASIRHDGSSKLAQHWGTMPAFSAGWRISAEPFMQNLSFINDLKLRGGWGVNGNQEGIANYARYGLVNYSRRTPTNPLSGPSSAQITYGNPDLRWETSAQTGVGLDVSMFNSRIALNLDAYIKKTSDVLLNVQLPSTLPITRILTNAGKINNKGIEINLRTINMSSADFNWTTNFNMSFNRNEVVELEYVESYDFGRIYSNNQDVIRLKEGASLGSFYGYVSDGVDPETGDMIYRDINNNGINDPGDRTVIGDAQPDFIFGLTNTFTYKRFDFSFFFQGSYGNEIYNATRIDLEGMFDSKNQSLAVLRRWTPDNTQTDIPRAIPKSSGSVYNVWNSSRFIEDGSYLRLKSLTLSYRILDNEVNFKAIKKLTAYFTGQNLLTFTNYSGYDPEVNAYGNSATEQGIDYGTYPQARTLIIGLNVEF
ncbi:MAG: SusC/RagA family TonB-linked outer membrane protein [Salinivirgaceae bacterium]